MASHEGAPGAPNSVPPQAQPDETQRHSVHHSYIWLGGLRGGAIVLAALVAGSTGSISSLIPLITEGGSFARLVIAAAAMLVLVVVAFGIMFLYQFLSYKHLYYELTPKELSVHQGIFNKKHSHVPYVRIQSVDERASLLQRVFGVCTVNVDTAGGAANKAVVIPYLQKTEAENLRRELFGRKQYLLAVKEGATPQQAWQAAAAAAGMVGGASAVQAGAASNAGAPVATPPFASSGAPGVPGVSGAPGAAVPPVASGAAAGNVLDAPAKVWDAYGGGVFGGSGAYTGAVSYEYGLTNKELVLTGLSNNTAFAMVAVGVLAGVGQFMGDVVPLLVSMHATQFVGKVSTGLFNGALVFAVATFLAVTVVLWLCSAVATCVQYGGFRARRRDNRIEVERGLLQHQFQGVDVDRVQSVTIRQSFVRRLIGYCEISLGKIDATFEGGSDQSRAASSPQGLVIHPFVKMSRVPEILAGIIPEYADVPAKVTPVAPVALRRAVVRRCVLFGVGFWLAVLTALSQGLLHAFAGVIWADDAGVASFALPVFDISAVVLYAISAVVLVCEAVAAVLWARGSGFAYNRRFMQVANGGLSRETTSFLRSKIQFGYTRTNPFQRRAHTATISARTASGVSGTTVRLIDVREDDAYAWLDWLKPQGNVLE